MTFRLSRPGIAALTFISCADTMVEADLVPLVRDAVFATSVDELGRAVERVEEPRFSAMSEIYLSLELDRHVAGTFEFVWLYRDQELGRANMALLPMVDGQPDPAVAFSVFEPRAPLPVGAGYRVDATFSGKHLGSWPFSIEPGTDAIPTRVHEVNTAGSVDELQRPTAFSDRFGPSDRVFVTGRADFGVDSWIEAGWAVDGRRYSACAKRLQITRNIEGVSFSFHCLPDGGWPAGEHEVWVILDGAEVARRSFQVVQPGG